MTDTISVVISNINFTRTNKMTGLVTEIKEYISVNKSATLANIADHFHLSPGYLSVIFSKNTDTTLKNYLINERINTAKDMLINTDKNIYEIANEIGYKTAQLFSVIFKKVLDLPRRHTKPNINIYKKIRWLIKSQSSYFLYVS